LDGVYLVRESELGSVGRSESLDFMGPLGLSHPSHIHQHEPRIQPRLPVERNLIPRSSVVKETWGHSAQLPSRQRSEFRPELSNAFQENEIRVHVDEGVVGGEEVWEEETERRTGTKELPHPFRT